MKKRTKIVATLGPASESKEILKEMIKNGMNVARINFSHSDHEYNGKLIQTMQELREEMQVPVGIMADFQGPRIRTIVEKDLEIKKGEIVLVYDSSLVSKFEIRNSKFEANSNAQIQNFKTIKLDQDGIVESLNIGDAILIEDGKIKLKVIKKEKGFAEAEVEEGGIVKNHKGVNLPDTAMDLPAITKKDEEDLKFALKKNIDFVAMSFVGKAEDILQMKDKIKEYSLEQKEFPWIVAKIERKEAIKNLEEIIKVADAIMVARGDLGIEMPESEVAILQKEIVVKSLQHAKPVIVATQMLDSMIENPIPTRAEVSDVTNAVVDHADAVMLSGETSSGRYPIEVIKTMAEIIKKTEDSPFDDLKHGFLKDDLSSVSSAVAKSAHDLAKNSGASAIIVASLSGFTARMIVRHRPQQNVLVITNSKKTFQQLSLIWGTESFILSDCTSLDELISLSIQVLKEKKVIDSGDRAVIVTGRPHVKKEHMSLVKIEEVK